MTQETSEVYSAAPKANMGMFNSQICYNITEVFNGLQYFQPYM